MALPDDFAVFILAHGRPDSIPTYGTMRRAGYTGPMYIVCDDEDKTLPQYQAQYGDSVLVFSKDKYEWTFDAGDNFLHRRGSPIYARNAIFDLAESVGVKWFLELDDDYTRFGFRVGQDGSSLGTMHPRITAGMDVLIESFLEYFQSIDAASVAFSQGGDWYDNGRYGTVKRKAMNAFFLTTERRFMWCGRMNDDVTTYVTHGNRGLVFLTSMLIDLEQFRTQQNAGGLTQLYLDVGTYVKSFYSVMFQPSSVVVTTIDNMHSRLHHKVNWSNTVPMIVSEDLRKP